MLCAITTRLGWLLGFVFSAAPLAAQQQNFKDVCDALRYAQARNATLRLTLPNDSIEGRIVIGSCPEDVRVALNPRDLTELRSIQVRRVTSDRLGNGIALGALIGAPAGWLFFAAATAGDAMAERSIAAGAVVGGVIGAIVDAVRGRSSRWVELWHSSRTSQDD